MNKLMTGVKPTGSSMHLGNLMGAVLPAYKASFGNDSAIFIADLHALTSVKNGDLLREQTRELALEYFAIYGIDTPTKIFRQSDIVHITKLMWILANVTPYGLMLRAHSFKDSEAKNSEINMGVFNYPILMAADILGYGITGVPVGKDQVQHLEMTRDIARSFNTTYNCSVFYEPQAIVRTAVATLPGIDGRKMSKSYNNFIGVFDDEALLKKRVMSIVTDSLGIDEAKNPDTCHVFALISAIGETDEIETIRAKYQAANAGFGYGHAKIELFNILNRFLSPYRQARMRLIDEGDLIEAKLQEGAREMNTRLNATLAEVTRLTGIS